ncbi:MAG: hypothetical protein AABW54_02515 [Candidatus Micrarchaeota archaeon]
MEYLEVARFKSPLKGINNIDWKSAENRRVLLPAVARKLHSSLSGIVSSNVGVESLSVAPASGRSGLALYVKRTDAPYLCLTKFGGTHLRLLVRGDNIAVLHPCTRAVEAYLGVSRPLARVLFAKPYSLEGSAWLQAPEGQQVLLVLREFLHQELTQRKLVPALHLSRVGLQPVRRGRKLSFKLFSLPGAGNKWSAVIRVCDKTGLMELESVRRA